MANLVYIMGKSSAGKDTVYQRIKDKIDTNQYVPYTTRPKRDGEQEGREYNFLNREQFEELQKQEKVMEYRNYNVINAKGEKDIWTYATIADNQWEKQGDFLSIGTLESYVSIMKYLEEHPEKNLNILPVYIFIDENERARRARKREESQAKPNYEEMKRRLDADNIDFSEEKLKEAGITKKETFENYDLDECIQNIIKYVQKEREQGLTLKEKYKVDVKPIVIEQKETNKQEEEER